MTWLNVDVGAWSHHRKRQEGNAYSCGHQGVMEAASCDNVVEQFQEKPDGDNS